MKSIKKSAIIFAIAGAGFWAIHVTKQPASATGQRHFTLEELGWQSSAAQLNTTGETKGGILSTADVAMPMESTITFVCSGSGCPISNYRRIP